MNRYQLKIASGWGPGHIWLHTTLEGPWPHYMLLEVRWDRLWTLSFGLSQFHGHSSWLVCEVTLRTTSHTSLSARDHYTSSTLISGKGGAGPGWLRFLLGSHNFIGMALGSCEVALRYVGVVWFVVWCSTNRIYTTKLVLYSQIYDGTFFLNRLGITASLI